MGVNAPESSLAALLRRATAYVALAAAAALAMLFFLSLISCEPAAARPGVSLSMTRAKDSPRDAAVTIDEEYVGPLGFVAVRGVRLPAGKHRISVEKPGYFPWDRLVDAGHDPIHLDVSLDPIPD